MKPSRIARMLQILTALQSGRNDGVDGLAQMHKLSRRTIFRDLKELRAIGVPCNYDAKSRGYKIDEDFLLPPINLTQEEALGLLLLAYKASSHINLPFRKAILLAAMKLENNLPGKMRQYCNTVLRYISLKPGPPTTIDMLEKIFVQLQEAILRKRVVSIRYYLLGERKHITIDLEPYHLMYNDHTWYVLGKSNPHRGFQALKLHRIKELTMSDKCFVEDERFDIQDCLGRAWAMVPEGRLYNVKLRFSPEVACDVAAVQWHDTQMVTFEDDGSAILEFRVDGLHEISWWILSYGDRVQVLAPRILREKITEMAQRVVETNQQESHAR